MTNGPAEIEAEVKARVARLRRLLRRERKTLSARDAAKQAGLSHSTMWRVESGKMPDLVTYTKLSRWVAARAYQRKDRT